MLVLYSYIHDFFFFFFQAEDGIRDKLVTGVQTCALPISERSLGRSVRSYCSSSDFVSRTFSSVTGGRPRRGGERFGAQVVQILGAPEQRSARIRMRKRAAQGATTEMGRMGAEDPRSRAGSTSLTQRFQRHRQRLLGRGR